MCNTYHLHVGCMYTRCKWKFSTNGHVMFLLSATKLRRLCFYTCRSVILFTGGSASVHAGIQPPRPGTPRPGTPRPGTPSEQTPPRSRHPPDQAPQQEQTPLRSRHPPDQAPPWEQTHTPWTRHPPAETATAADGMHPTGMHSNYISFLIITAHNKVVAR